jgi:hypothetical protein
VGVVYPVKTGPIKEIIVNASPLTQKWMRSFIRDFSNRLRDDILRSWNIKKIRKAAAAISCDVIHVVNHGPFSNALTGQPSLAGKELWVSFHDHFSTTFSSVDDARQLWHAAHRRLVISNELALEYQRLFGQADFEIITDGVADYEVRLPSSVIESPVQVYFAGLLHLDYKPLFEVLGAALDELSNEGFKFKFILRGTQMVDFLNNRNFETEFRPVTLNSDELKAELDASSILYLPIKFSVPDFYLYSLSTKMVGYLGGRGAILYHGPADSAAANLLAKTYAAMCCYTLNASDLVLSIKELLADKSKISGNAKKLASSAFNLKTMQSRFWGEEV